MRVIYSIYFVDPWVKVAQKLKKEHGYEPVYWNGFEDDDSKTIVSNAFPKVIYNSSFDAWKSILPKEIADRFAGSYINIDFLKDNASYELQAIKMMDRMDPDRYSFNFMERQRHFRNLLKYWTACINYLKPDLVVSDYVPHIVFDYVLYLLCKFHNIKFVAFRGSPFLGRAIPLTDILSIGDIFDEEYVKIVNSGSGIELLKQNLPNEIIESYEKVKLDYDFAKPDYMKKHLLEHEKSSGFLSLTKKFILDMMQSKNRYFGKDGFFLKGFSTSFKQRSKNIENSSSTIFNYAILKLKANQYKTKLKNYYNSLVIEPDFAVPFVIVYLHYQPEMTSSPAGDIFVDQRLCIELLAKNLPSDYLIYVKEHPSQFYSHIGGHMGRIQEFYDDLRKYPQVCFMPLHVDPFALLTHSRAVATVTGTSAWEAMVLGKPVINFGLAWYEKYVGVLKIVDEKSAAKIMQFIENFKFDERNLLAYLNAFSKKTVKAYVQRGWKEKMNQVEAECVSNLAESIFHMAQK
jgi:hypothetical protein